MDKETHLKIFFIKNLNTLMQNVVWCRSWILSKCFFWSTKCCSWSIFFIIMKNGSCGFSSWYLAYIFIYRNCCTTRRHFHVLSWFRVIPCFSSLVRFVYSFSSVGGNSHRWRVSRRIFSRKYQHSFTPTTLNWLKSIKLLKTKKCKKKNG